MEQAQRFKKGKKVSYLMIAGNLFLAALKISVGLIVGSSALVADGFHSFSDIVSTTGVLVALYVANRPPDAKHQYGHGQAEPLAAMMLGLILIMTGGLLAYNSVMTIISGEYEILGLFGFWAAVFSIILKEIMFRYSYRIGKETNNQSLKADAWHHRSDAVSSLAAAAGIMGSYLGYPILDPAAGAVVSLLILRVGWKIIQKAVTSLLTVSPDQKKLDEIKRIANTVDGVVEITELKAHYSGGDLFIDLKILVDYSLTVLKGHQIAVEVKQKLCEEMPETEEVLVHVNPGFLYGEEE